MGAWGPAIFSDDTACDIRDEYRDLVGDGKTGEEATDILIVNWDPQMDDPEEYTVFWLALAATQWKAGRLEERVKSKAIEIIDKGSNIEVWKENEEENADIKKRISNLDKLKKELLSPQPEVKKNKEAF